MVQTQMMTIGVMIVDDHAIVRSGLSTFLSLHDDIRLVSVASGGNAAIDYYRKHKPDVTLMDLVMSDVSGVDVIRKIRQTDSEAKLIVLTSFSEGRLVRDAITAGAVGYLTKDISGNDLAAAIRRVHSGETIISPTIARILKEHSRPRFLVDDLSRREVEVLELIVAGHTTLEMAHKLQVKPSSVKTYISRLYTKLNVYNRAEATAVALEYNLIG
jgi:DNA-binding NarL/FixJ family response regulator